VFKSKLVIAVIAFSGVVGAAVYALRLFITAMHNRVGPRVGSVEIGLAEFAAIAPIVLVVLVFAFYPQFVLKRSEPTVKQTVAAVAPGTPRRVAHVPSGWTAYAPLTTASASP
jgi:NADH-quinone oxidoreductase subunit M